MQMLQHRTTSTLARRGKAAPRCSLARAQRLRAVAVEQVQASIERKQTYLGEQFERVVPDGGDRHAARPLTVRSLNHIAVPVKDVDASVHFYHKVLGFQPLPRPAFKFSGAWLQAGDMTLHLIAADPTAPEAISNWKGQWQAQESVMRQPLGQPEPWWIRRSRHLAFQVDDLASAEASLQAHNIQYDKFVVPGTGAAQLFFYDPDGNGLEVADYRPIASAMGHQ